MNYSQVKAKHVFLKSSLPAYIALCSWCTEGPFTMKDLEATFISCMSLFYVCSIQWCYRALLLGWVLCWSVIWVNTEYYSCGVVFILLLIIHNWRLCTPGNRRYSGLGGSLSSDYIHKDRPHVSVELHANNHSQLKYYVSNKAMIVKNVAPFRAAL